MGLITRSHVWFVALSAMGMLCVLSWITHTHPLQERCLVTQCDNTTLLMWCHGMLCCVGEDKVCSVVDHTAMYVVYATNAFLVHSLAVGSHITSSNKAFSSSPLVDTVALQSTGDFH